MVIFDPPIFIKQPDEDADVLVFGKFPKLKTEDAENGIARFGGPFRSPSYLHAYFSSADILVNEGVRVNCLDDIGLPIFYIQRHTIELLLKRLLSWIYEIAEFRSELGIGDFGVPDNEQRRRLGGCHKLDGLLRDLEHWSKKLGLEEPPVELKNIVNYFAKIEKTMNRAKNSKQWVLCFIIGTKPCINKFYGAITESIKKNIPAGITLDYSSEYYLDELFTENLAGGTLRPLPGNRLLVGLRGTVVAVGSKSWAVGNASPLGKDWVHNPSCGVGWRCWHPPVRRHLLRKSHHCAHRPNCQWQHSRC